ncbi:zinc ribbon domain-containing protein [Natrononativus amylolyticus]|uniref:zinc ribbon domain-containing protein n=1 Tax=Natrononativus amylolyticus TaxID=2963434 RepID=UPI0020CCF969|nr:zinc ribbon domain-containing protein [Natrononativus amylolyticus]
MGFFERAGRKVEEFKQEATRTAESEAEYECTACGERFYTAQTACPECDSDAIEPLE